MTSPAEPRFAPEAVPAYSGLLDDFSLRFEDYGIVDVTVLNRRLINAVLIGDPLLVNDGYAIMSPKLRSAVTEPDRSPFCNLVEGGFVKILTRNFMAKSFRHWPPIDRVDVSEIFDRTATAAYNAMAERGDVSRSCSRSVSWKVSMRRSRVRSNIAERSGKGRGQAPRRGTALQGLHLRLMQVASEAYQYAWRCALSEPRHPVRVQTQAPRYLDFDLKVPLDGEAESCQVSIEVPLYDVAYNEAGSELGAARGRCEG